MARCLSFIDKLIIQSDNMLKTLVRSVSSKHSVSPSVDVDEGRLTKSEKKHSAGLMRVNHTGEVCAQALYQGQALTAKLSGIREEMERAAAEEIDHLVWCDQRLKELGQRPSYLNPFFYTASFGLGAIAGCIGDRVSLGFVAATEELVCQHLNTHLQKLPYSDYKSRAIVQQMSDDEAKHRQMALDAGAYSFPLPIKWSMSLTSKVMTKVTYYI